MKVYVVVEIHYTKLILLYFKNVIDFNILHERCNIVHVFCMFIKVSCCCSTFGWTLYTSFCILLRAANVLLSTLNFMMYFCIVLKPSGANTHCCWFTLNHQLPLPPLSIPRLMRSKLFYVIHSEVCMSLAITWLSQDTYSSNCTCLQLAPVMFCSAVFCCIFSVTGLI